MVNRSKADSPRYWETWRKAGAVAEHPRAAEEREKAAESRLRQYYTFDESGLTEGTLEQFLQDMRKRNTAEKTGQAGWGSPEDHPYPQALKAHPELTEEEMVEPDSLDKYGMTNNFWRYFFPEFREDMQQWLSAGKLDVRGREAIFYFFLKEENLMEVFSRVGYDRVKRMHDALGKYLALDKEWKERLGDSPMALKYGLPGIPKSSLISDEEKTEYKKADIEFTNTLRLIAIELHNQGVAWSLIMG